MVILQHVINCVVFVIERQMFLQYKPLLFKLSRVLVTVDGDSIGKSIY
jgi:hypothetical protein